MSKNKPKSKLLKVDTRDLEIKQQNREQAIKLLRSWREDDEQEQKETWEYLKVALDQDRLSLFSKD